MRSTLRDLSLATCLALLATTPVPAFGETPGGGDDALIREVVANLERTGEQLVALAGATPADRFGWAPTDEVRTVSEVYMHIVGTNVMLPNALGLALPEGVEIGAAGPFALMHEWEQTITDKDAVIARLRESYAYLADALPRIGPLDEEVSLFGPPASKRSYLLLLLAHSHEHLGQSIAYARSIGVVPPWSQPPSGDEPAAEEEVE